MAISRARAIQRAPGWYLDALLSTTQAGASGAWLIFYFRDGGTALDLTVSAGFALAAVVFGVRARRRPACLPESVGKHESERDANAC